MKITLKSVFVGLAAVLALVGFGMMFLSPVKSVVDLGIIGKSEVAIPWDTVFFGIVDGEAVQDAPKATLSMIGFLAMGFGGLLGLIFASFAGKKGKGLLKVIFGVIVLVLLAGGGVLALLTKAVYLNALGVEGDAAQLFQLNLGAILGGAFGLGGALLTLIAMFLPSAKK